MEGDVDDVQGSLSERDSFQRLFTSTIAQRLLSSRGLNIGLGLVGLRASGVSFTPRVHLVRLG